MSFKPQLYPNKQVDPEEMKYPLIASYKLDGVRCIIHKGELYSRSWKPLPNKQLRERFSELLQWSLVYDDSYLDGEIYSHVLAFNKLSGLVRRHDEELPESVQFWLFDVIHPLDARYQERLTIVKSIAQRYNTPTPDTFKVNSAEDVRIIMERALDEGYEGLILNNPGAEYKNGRITINSANGYKMKPYRTYDSTIIGITQATVVDPQAEKTINELGYSETSNKKGDRVPIPMAACFIVKHNGHEVDVVIAEDEDTKKQIWVNQEEYIGKVVEWKGLEVGMKDKPRHPVSIRIRYDK